MQLVCILYAKLFLNGNPTQMFVSRQQAAV